MIPAPGTVTELDVDILARTVWGEARGESRQGKIAVAWVVLNRATHPRRWPKDLPAAGGHARGKIDHMPADAAIHVSGDEK